MFGFRTQNKLFKSSDGFNQLNMISFTAVATVFITFFNFKELANNVSWWIT